MADQRENEDIQLYEQKIEGNVDLTVEQPTQPVTEFCQKALTNESLLPESQLSVVKQIGSQIQQELCVCSPESTVNEMNGNRISSVIPATPDTKRNLDAGKSSEVAASEKCDTLVSSVVADHQKMELSVSAQLEILSFERSQIMNQNSGQQLGHCHDFPQAGEALRDVTAQEEFTEDDDTSSSEDTSSESDSDTTSSSSSLSLTVISEGEDDEQEPGEKKRPPPVKTKDELLLDDLPKVEEINIVLPEDVQNEPIGIVSSIIDQLVIVESLKDIPPVNEETFLFRKNRCSVGQVFEVFGPVCHPFYVLRFNSREDIAAKGIELHELLYFAPTVKDFTQYIFAEQLKREKGSDASWRNDQEPPPEALDFSDDEKEKEAKRKKKKQQNPADKNSRTGRKEDGQASQQTQAQSLRGRGFQHSSGQGFGPYSSARKKRMMALLANLPLQHFSSLCRGSLEEMTERVRRTQPSSNAHLCCSFV
ncbi:H/ACA ribonucleoprotein complex non-core subunit NAF1 isoform X2 [Narcine bancroftii]|uniref:H/ACA ribonucleoprotein complex non-core subunit NAF1 isoform X2 n=1 Tax=Narcine bancroftii TaxID=1343680 RepID=UPI003831FDF5